MIYKRFTNLIYQLLREIENQQTTFFLLLSLILGLIPALNFVHILAKDANSYYILGESFYTNHAYAFGQVTSYGGTAINSGLNSRAPLYPFLLAFSMIFFKRTLLATYLPLLIVRSAIIPFTYLIGKRHLPPFMAFLASFTLLFFPKLQTYSLAAIEADSLVVLFFLITVYTYYLVTPSGNKKLMAIGVSLALLMLSKETGFPLALGIIGAVFLESHKNFKHPVFTIKNLLYVITPCIVLTAPFFAMTLRLQGLLYANVMTIDKQITYIPQNIVPIIQTVPIYMGLEELFIDPKPLRGYLLSLIFLGFVGAGLVNFIRRKFYALILPVATAVLSIALVNPKTMGGNIPANFQLITIMPFVLPPLSIMLYSGYQTSILYLLKKLRLKNYLKDGFVFIGASVIFLKILNNYYAKPYTMDYAGEYYISFWSILRHSLEIPASVFVKNEQGRFMIVRQYMHEFVKNQYEEMKVKVIDPSSKKYYIGLIVLSLVVASLNKGNFSYPVNMKSG